MTHRIAALAGEPAATCAKMLLVIAAGQTFALPAAELREVTPFATVTRVPGQPAHLLGLVSLRGEMIAVLDLAARLAATRPADARRAFLVAVGGRGKCCALAVEAVAGVLNFDLSERPDLPIPRRPGAEGCSAGWLRGPDGPVEVLNLSALCGFDTSRGAAG